MCVPLTPQASPKARETAPMVALDELAWERWLAKGQARDHAGARSRVRAVKWLSIVTLLVAAQLWSQLAGYSLVILFSVTLGALIVMMDLIEQRRFAWAASLGVVALLFNPLLPVLRSTGEWQSVLALCSTVPFLASLSRR